MTWNLKEFVNQHAEVRSACDSFHGTHVAILLAHYNGGDMLAEQLQSLSAQTHQDWSLIISDDGSSDGWLDTATAFAKANPKRRVWLRHGPRRGYVQNFLSLVATAGPTVPYAAFCDQDDVWCPEKLEAALTVLRRLPPEKPAVYCGRTTVVDCDLVPLHLSPLFTRSPSFRNALVQSIAGGNTMVLNRAAIDLLQDTMRHADGVISHDWWVYQIVCGAGGTLIYDTEPHVLYRQHQNNLIGSNSGWTARIARLKALLRGRFRDWTTANCAALNRSRHWLTPDARETLFEFDAARSGPLLKRLFALKRSGVFRQSQRSQLALWLATVLKKL
ncbi:MAG: glycosyltransferase family 2 protein [Pseudomonadota bacterium]